MNRAFDLGTIQLGLLETNQKNISVTKNYDTDRDIGKLSY